MTTRLAGKTALITGAASGQGRAAAVRFAAEGADLALTDVDTKGLSETVALVRVDHDVRVYSSRCDMADVSDIEAFALGCLETYPAVDIVYNNAGVMSRLSIVETTESDWDLVNAINVKGPFFLTKFMLPGLLKSGPGATVINVSSISALTPPREGNTAYAASKGALVSLTRAQARDLAPHGIRVNCIVPGPIDTPMPAGAFEGLPEEARPAAREAAVSRNMIKRFGTSEEVVSLAVYLASDEASYMTAAIIPVDGGWTGS
jgi:NAD(P)-dependent dehydrogenase (short-subunit alcohol dehydrogenase family)